MTKRRRKNYVKSSLQREKSFLNNPRSFQVGKKYRHSKVSSLPEWIISFGILWSQSPGSTVLTYDILYLFVSLNSDVIFSSVIFAKDMRLDAMEQQGIKRYRTLEVKSLMQCCIFIFSNNWNAYFEIFSRKEMRL